MSTSTQHGYLLIADISGYTSFVAGTELEHAHEILTDLLETICGRIQTLLTIHKLEGDAVFAYAPETRIQRGESLLELIESTYTAFRDRQISIKRATTCTCRACSNLPSLDLKFISHHGEYIMQKVANITEMVGSDVNLVHRLLKNGVADATHWRAYALFTEQSLAHMDIQLEATHKLVETYEHLGEVKTESIDMHARYAELNAARRVVVTEQDADLVLRTDFPVPPPIAWEWLQDPARRNLWSDGVRWSTGARPGGRTGVGASNHCAHGNGTNTEVTLDWHPFECSTTESIENGRTRFIETFQLEELPDGTTRLHDLIQAKVPLPAWLRRMILKYMFVHVHKYDESLRKAARLAGEHAASTN
jgi:hypothetical protein